MNQFRRINRLTKYDYSQLGYYFITACCDRKIEYFGQVENGVMKLNECGQAANNIWLEIPQHYKNIGIDEFIVMPNHMHGIIVIQDVVQATGLPAGLSQVVGSYKNVVSKRIRQEVLKEFAWQPSFYDHVIRKEDSLDKIREYITNNPLKWELDRNNPSNLWM